MVEAAKSQEGICKAAGENREEGVAKPAARPDNKADQDEQTAARLEVRRCGRRGGASEEGAILASCFSPVKPRRTQAVVVTMDLMRKGPFGPSVTKTLFRCLTSC